LTDLVAGDVDRRQRGIRKLRKADIIKPRNGHLLRNRDALISEFFQHANRRYVVHAEDRRRPEPGAEQFASRIPSGKEPI
jgi:hypothetical protein